METWYSQLLLLSEIEDALSQTGCCLRTSSLLFAAIVSPLKLSNYSDCACGTVNWWSAHAMPLEWPSKQAAIY